VTIPSDEVAIPTAHGRKRILKTPKPLDSETHANCILLRILVQSHKKRQLSGRFGDVLLNRTNISITQKLDRGVLMNDVRNTSTKFTECWGRFTSRRFHC
jgi:hypothetical protein